MSEKNSENFGACIPSRNAERVQLCRAEQIVSFVYTVDIKKRLLDVDPTIETKQQYIERCRERMIASMNSRECGPMLVRAMHRDILDAASRKTGTETCHLVCVLYPCGGIAVHDTANSAPDVLRSAINKEHARVMAGS